MTIKPLIKSAIMLGVDLQLVIEHTGSGYKVKALNAAGGLLMELGRTAVYPTDAEYGAARATALHLFPERVAPKPDVPAEPVIKPHKYKRDASSDVPWACTQCPLDAHNPIHGKTTTPGAAR